ncbi:MAG: hypothetical protein ACOCY1_05920 [Halovenus sp.]
MVDIDQIEEEEMTSEEVLDRYTAEPQTEPEWVPEWDEYPEERPGDNTRIEDDALLWERDGFAVRLESYETTHWRIEIEIPEHVGEHYPRGFELKCRPKPEYGFVKSVEQKDYVTTGATLIIAENRQPVYEVQAFIDDLLESAEQSQQFIDDIEEAMAVAKGNEE